MASQKYIQLLEDMKQLHINKNAGYAGEDNPDAWANFREAEDLGVSAFKGCLVRASDKWIRIRNLLRNPANEKVGESVKDTLMDLASYCLIAICLMEEEKIIKDAVGWIIQGKPTQNQNTNSTGAVTNDK